MATVEGGDGGSKIGQGIGVLLYINQIHEVEHSLVRLMWTRISHYQGVVVVLPIFILLVEFKN